MIETPEAEPGQPALHWTLDKRVPIALIFAIILQTGGAVWWASNLAARVSTLEAVNVEAAARQLVVNALDIPGRVIRLETNFANVTDQIKTVGDQLKTINEKVDRLLERRP